MTDKLSIRFAESQDVPLILSFIKQLAAYEKLSHEVVATEQSLLETLFGPNPCAEVMIAELDGQPTGFALFFQNYSTFLGRPGIYLEDLFVLPEARGKGVGKQLLVKLSQIAVERGCGRLEWSVLDWNKPAIDFYNSIAAIPMDSWTVNRLTGKALINLAGTGDGL